MLPEHNYCFVDACGVSLRSDVAGQKVVNRKRKPEKSRCHMSQRTVKAQTNCDASGARAKFSAKPPFYRYSERRKVSRKGDASARD